MLLDMNGPENHPIVLLVVASIIVSFIGAGIFSVWAKYDVIPSSRDDSFVKTSCYVQSSKIANETEKCSCFDEGLLCSDTYPCIVIKVLVQLGNRKSKEVILYKDLTSYTFSSKCSYYPLGRACVGNDTQTHWLALRFLHYRGTVGTNFSCYTNNLDIPEVVVAEENDQDAAKLVLFILSILLFFLPLIVMNCFFFYKWKLVAFLRFTLTRHHRVSVASSYGDERRGTAFTTTNFQVE